MKSQLFIASKIKVGFNLRSDTYTGKLGYVIGYDGKKWRKEPSWEGWRLKYNSDEELLALKTKKFNEIVEATKKQHQSYIEYYKTHKYESYKRYSEMTELEFLAQNNLDDFSKWSKENSNYYIGKISDDESIKPVEYENVPTEGFVLNKKAGGYSTGWNHRSTYCRVYDPRGFEFEITIPNLLFILQETSAVKGKGLEGEFVYAWDGKDLVLLPAHCEEYKQSTQFTKLQSGKIGVKDLIPGCSYKKKNQEDLIYLGKYNYYSLGLPKGRKRYYAPRETQMDKFHIFVNKNENYEILSSLSSLATRNSDVPVSNYAELMQKFSSSQYASKPVALEEEPVEIKFTENITHYTPLDGRYYLKIAEGSYTKNRIYPYFAWERDISGGSKHVFKGYTIYRESKIDFIKGVLRVESSHSNSDKFISRENLESMDFKKLIVKFENGNKTVVENY